MCQNKTVNRAYHVICDKCATEKQICAKCYAKSEYFLGFGLYFKLILFRKNERAQRNKENQKLLEETLKKLPERVKRLALRKLKSGDLYVNSDEEDEEEEGEQDDESEEEKSDLKEVVTSTKTEN